MMILEQMAQCQFYSQISTSDGEGGQTVAWVAGNTFDANVRLNASVTAQTAQKLDAKSVYTVIASSAVELGFHAVFKRLEDGKIFRVTSEPKKTPTAATLQLIKATAEEWQLT